MSNSYSRLCKKCGRRINMRKMPAGQWVAFEGYDQLHDCSRPSYSGTGYKQNANEKIDSNPGFANFEIKRQPDIASHNSPTDEPGQKTNYSNNSFGNSSSNWSAKNSATNNRYNSPGYNNTPLKWTNRIPLWIWGLLGGVVLIILISRS